MNRTLLGESAASRHWRPKRRSPRRRCRTSRACVDPRRRGRPRPEPGLHAEGEFVLFEDALGLQRLDRRSRPAQYAEQHGGVVAPRRRGVRSGGWGSPAASRRFDPAHRRALVGHRESGAVDPRPPPAELVVMKPAGSRSRFRDRRPSGGGGTHELEGPGASEDARAWADPGLHAAEQAEVVGVSPDLGEELADQAALAPRLELRGLAAASLAGPPAPPIVPGGLVVEGVDVTRGARVEEDLLALRHGGRTSGRGDRRRGRRRGR